mmetsp:Transcript_119969/g.231400  ORF Transcript_119969/g.231400 Transcript_119969/m.231400 type:complete len:204 (-) Transcript_119969:1519-2130(-)
MLVKMGLPSGEGSANNWTPTTPFASSVRVHSLTKRTSLHHGCTLSLQVVERIRDDLGKNVFVQALLLVICSSGIFLFKFAAFLDNILVAQVLPVQLCTKLVEADGPPEERSGTDDGRANSGGPFDQQACHHDEVDEKSHMDMYTLKSKVVATKVLLLALCIRNEIAIDELAESKIQPHHQTQQRTDGAEDKAKDKHECKTRTA